MDKNMRQGSKTASKKVRKVSKAAKIRTLAICSKAVPVVDLAKLGGLLAVIWPADRIVQGMRVCKGIRLELLLADHITLQSTWRARNINADEDQIGEDLIKWGTAPRSAKVSLRIECEKGTCLPKAFFSALRFAIRDVASWSLCHNLVRLDLRNNALHKDQTTHLGGQLRHCQSLTHLDVSRNAINSVGAWRVCACIQRLTTLHHLNLAEIGMDDSYMPLIMRNLKGIPLAVLILGGNQIGDGGAAHVARILPSLTTLSHLNLAGSPAWGGGIGAGSAGELGEALAQLPALSRLDLSGNSLGDVCAALLAEWLPQCPALTWLSLDANLIANEGANALASTLEQSGLLKHLSLAGRIQDAETGLIGSAGMTSLAAALKLLSSLSHLDLSHNRIGNDGVSSIAEVLAAGSSLTYLDIGWNSVRADAFEALVGHCSGLTHLGLGNHCSCSPFPLTSTTDGAYDGFGSRFLRECSRLRRLELATLRRSAPAFADEACLSLTQAVRQNTSLTYLDLTNTNMLIGKKLMQGVCKSWSLSHLALSGNYFEEDAIKLLGREIGRLCVLSRLDLSNCAMRDESVVVLAKALPKCTALKQLKLGSKAGAPENQIGPVGGQAIGAALGQCYRLTDLDMQGNGRLNYQEDKDRSEEAVLCLAEGLARCTSLERLGLGGCGVQRRGLAALAAVIGDCSALSELSLEKNGIGSQTGGGSWELARLVASAKGLTRLNLQHNELRDQGLRILTAGLIASTSLAHLSLNSNGLGADGGVVVSCAIELCPSLTFLNLTDNFPEGSTAVIARLHATFVPAEVEVIQLEGTGEQDAQAFGLRYASLPHAALGERWCMAARLGNRVTVFRRELNFGETALHLWLNL